MIELIYKKRWFGKGAINIPDCWEDLSPSQFIDVIALTEAAASGNYPLMTFRLLLLQYLTGYQRSKKRMKPEYAETINSNLIILANMLRFPLKPRYRDEEYIEILSPEVQELVRENFIYDITEAKYQPEINLIRDRISFSPEIRLNMKRNLLPQIKIGRTIYYGPHISIDANGIAETDIVAQEWLDALEMHDAWQKYNTPEYLAGMVAVLYRQKRSNYHSNEVIERRRLFMNLPVKTLRAVVYVLANLFHYILKHPVYGTLFTGNEQKTKMNTGYSVIISALSRDGYGPPSEIQQKNLFEYLDILVDSLRNGIKMLRENKVKDFEIAKKLQIPIETVLKY